MMEAAGMTGVARSVSIRPLAKESAHTAGDALPIASVLTGLVLVCCTLQSGWILSTYISTATIVAYMLGLLVWRPQFYPKYLQFVFTVVTDIVGCLSCELVPAYLPELGVDSEFWGSVPLLILGRWFFVVAILVWDDCYGVEKTLGNIEKPRASYQVRPSREIVLSLSALYFLFVVVCFARVAAHPSFALGMDRFQYGDEYLPGIWSRLSGWLGYFIAIPLIAMRMGQVGLSLTSIVIYCLFLLWTGNKFGAFFTLVCIVLYAYYDKLFLLGRRRLMRFSVSLAVIMALLVTMTAGIEVITHGFDPVQYLARRTAQQGQLWWKIYGTYGPGEGLSELESEVDEQMQGLIEDKTKIGNNVGSRYGIYNIMYLSTDDARVDAKLESGSRYTEAGYPTAYYYFGAPGVVLFSVLGGILVAILTNAQIAAFIGGRMPTAVVVNKLMSSAATLLSMAIFYNLFTPGCWLSYFLLIFFWYIRRRDYRFEWL